MITNFDTIESIGIRSNFKETTIVIIIDLD